MNASNYTLKEFLTNSSLDQIIIPEMQRDYVWNKENVTNLLNSLKENHQRQNNIENEITDEFLQSFSPEIQATLLKALESNNNYFNIGFIYAYCDPELNGRYMLIDGQQRLTTIYLILLCLCRLEDKIDYFKKNYFKNNVLKIDYKVRESTHNFLLNFFDYILQGNDVNNVEDQFWYYDVYKTDITIQSLYNNYKVINEFFVKEKIKLTYLEDFVEFYYFDTNISHQGEELYIYMNSRGETIRSGESIKAFLLKGLTETEKHDWGKKWETWQNLFWVNRKPGENADNGFEEFLRWIKIIEFVKNDKKKQIQFQFDYIKQIKENTKVTSQELSLINIESYFIGLEKLIKNKDRVGLESNWICGEIPAIDYVKLLPVLMYTAKLPNCNNIDLTRFARFFKNVTRFELVSKNPYTSTINVINLTNKFLEDNNTDIVNIAKYKGDKSFNNILTNEEITKLDIFANCQPDIRCQIENSFWLAEDYKLCNGKIFFLLDFMDYNNLSNEFGLLDLTYFDKIFQTFKILFDRPTDHLRRALLTKGNYSVLDGRTSTLEGERFSFIFGDAYWKEQFLYTNRLSLYKLFIKDFLNRKEINPNHSTERILEDIIETYLDINPINNWQNYFIAHPEILEYCNQKFVCFQTTDIYNIFLLKDRNAGHNNYIRLSDFLGFN